MHKNLPMPRKTCESNGRLDVVLVETAGLSRSAAQRSIRAGLVRVNGTLMDKPNTLVRVGDTLEWVMPTPRATTLEAEDMALDICYEDADICVINKPQGMVVHPAPGHHTGTLVHGLMGHFEELPVIGGELRPGIVHRIDKMTSGLLVIARNDDAHRALSEQFKTHEAGRAYLAIVDDNIREDSGSILAPIGRHPVDRKRMAIADNGREAITHWSVIERYGSHTLLSLRLETGRTHQIRVHMASIRHPVSGDTVYGKRQNSLGLIGQALHGYRLSLRHPASGEPMSFLAGLPTYFRTALQRLGSQMDETDIIAAADKAHYGKDV